MRSGSMILMCVLFGAALVACAGDARAPQHEERDDFGVVVQAPIGDPPGRIVSLSPTTTELLFAIGAGPSLVGRTSWDVWPDSARLVPDLGPGIRPNIEAVLDARPDLVVLYGSADNRSAAEQLRMAGITVIAFRIDRIDEFRRATLLLGRATGHEARARLVADTVLQTIARVRQATASLDRPRIYWHIWDSPVITIGSGSFMNELVEVAGGRNVYDDLEPPSPQVALEDVARRNPDIVLAGPVGRARLLGDARWQAVAAVRRGEIRVVDTNLVSRSSVRLGEAAVSLARTLHGLELP